MSDIIKDAQQLLDGATPGPWVKSESEILDELIGGEHRQSGGDPTLVIGAKYWPGESPQESEPIGYWELEEALKKGVVENEDGAPYYYLLHHDGDGSLMAAAPEIAQALAEETWEYAAQAKRGDSWETCTNSETHLEEWWAGKDDAEWEAGRLKEQGRETRLVRRRVSPPEVINE